MKEGTIDCERAVVTVVTVPSLPQGISADPILRELVFRIRNDVFN